MIYQKLRSMARREMRRERLDHTLQPTALAHEAYLRLHKGGERWEGRPDFPAAAATALRRVLVEHARRRSRLKRGGDRVLESLEGDVAVPDRDERLLALDQALHRLGEFDPVLARLVELRFFGGHTVEEVARQLGTSVSSIARRWRLARAWLQANSKGPEPADEPRGLERHRATLREGR